MAAIKKDEIAMPMPVTDVFSLWRRADWSAPPCSVWLPGLIDLPAVPLRRGRRRRWVRSFRRRPCRPDEDHAVCVGGGVYVVGDHEDGLCVVGCGGT